MRKSSTGRGIGTKFPSNPGLSGVSYGYTFGRNRSLGGFMKGAAGLCRIFGAGIFLAFFVTGCGTLPGSGPLSLDPIRMANAIATDDVYHVRGAVESKVI